MIKLQDQWSREPFLVPSLILLLLLITSVAVMEALPLAGKSSITAAACIAAAPSTNITGEGYQGYYYPTGPASGVPSGSNTFAAQPSNTGPSNPASNPGLYPPIAPGPSATSLPYDSEAAYNYTYGAETSQQGYFPSAAPDKSVLSLALAAESASAGNPGSTGVLPIPPLPWDGDPADDKATLASCMANEESGTRNQLGGHYINGRPLAQESRRKVIEMHLAGSRSCEISRTLHVSHGCVSKIISRYNETGSYMPAHIGGSKPTVATMTVIESVIKFKMEEPSLFAWEVRRKLIESGICTEESAPSVSSINRIVRTKVPKMPELDAMGGFLVAESCMTPSAHPMNGHPPGYYHHSPGSAGMPYTPPWTPGHYNYSAREPYSMADVWRPPHSNPSYQQYNRQPYNQQYNQQYNQPYNQHYNQQYNQQYNQPYSQQYNPYPGYGEPLDVKPFAGGAPSVPTPMPTHGPNQFQFPHTALALPSNADPVDGNTTAVVPAATGLESAAATIATTATASDGVNYNGSSIRSNVSNAACPSTDSLLATGPSTESGRTTKALADRPADTTRSTLSNVTAAIGTAANTAPAVDPFTDGIPGISAPVDGAEAIGGNTKISASTSAGKVTTTGATTGPATAEGASGNTGTTTGVPARTSIAVGFSSASKTTSNTTVAHAVGTEGTVVDSNATSIAAGKQDTGSAAIAVSVGTVDEGHLPAGTTSTGTGAMSANTPTTTQQPLASSLLPTTLPSAMSAKTPATTQQPLASSLLPTTLPSAMSAKTPATTQQQLASSLLPTALPSAMSAKTPATTQQPLASSLLPTTLPSALLAKTPATTQQPLASSLLPTTLPSAILAKTPATTQQPLASSLLPITLPSQDQQSKYENAGLARPTKLPNPSDIISRQRQYSATDSTYQKYTGQNEYAYASSGGDYRNYRSSHPGMRQQQCGAMEYYQHTPYQQHAYSAQQWGQPPYMTPMTPMDQQGKPWSDYDMLNPPTLPDGMMHGPPWGNPDVMDSYYLPTKRPHRASSGESRSRPSASNTSSEGSRSNTSTPRKSGKEKRLKKKNIPATEKLKRRTKVNAAQLEDFLKSKKATA